MAYARTATLMWRGIARDSVQGIVNNQSRMEREIDRVIARLFAQFPPRTEASN